MADGDDLEGLVAGADPERYVATLFAPRELRPALIALYAFDHEIARIADVAHDPMVGHIRLAWWREQLDAIYAGKAAVHAPVIRALAPVVQRHLPPRAIFDDYLDARGHDLEEAPFADEAAMARHARAVSGGIMRLAARVLGAEHRADAVADHAGRAALYGRHLRAMASDAQHRHCRVPLAWLAEVGLGPEDIFAARATPAVRTVAQRLARAARAALVAANAERFPLRLMPVLAPATLARAAIGRVRAATFDPFAPAPAPPSWQRVARIALANLMWRV